MKNLALFTSALALFGAIVFNAHPVSAQSAPKKILFFSKSAGFEHDMIQEKNGQPSPAQVILEKIAKENNFEITFTKDGSVFTPENIAKYDAFYFHTTGDLTTPGTDKNPPMSKEGKKAFLEAIHHGKGFIGTHCAADTFHTPGGVGWKNDPNPDPYIQMIGGEFIIHGSQQHARQICVDKNFPGFSDFPDDFSPLEEWYSLKNFAPNLHVLLVQDTSKMDKADGGNRKGYNRPDYPSTWARMYGQGRVFYSSMGHRLDVWNNPVFQKVMIGGINWAVGNVTADVSPNLDKAAPEASTLPPE
jgi:type 1 glutamine amidotransferase